MVQLKKLIATTDINAVTPIEALLKLQSIKEILER
jgi:hypothetical protein